MLTSRPRATLPRKDTLGLPATLSKSRCTDFTSGWSGATPDRTKPACRGTGKERGAGAGSEARVVPAAATGWRRVRLGRRSGLCPHPDPTLPHNGRMRAGFGVGRARTERGGQRVQEVDVEFGLGAQEVLGGVEAGGARAYYANISQVRAPGVGGRPHAAANVGQEQATKHG